MDLKKDKKGLAEIVTVLLIIALTVAIFSIVAAFIIPMVKNYLNEGKQCYDAIGKLEVDTGEKLTCYNYGTKETGISVKRGEIELDSILISLQGEGTSKSFRLQKGAKLEGVRMYYNKSIEELEIPGKSESLTYVFNVSFKVDKVKIAPIINGKTCKESESVIGGCR